MPALRALVDPLTRGDPTSPLQWLTASTRTLAQELTARGHRVSRMTVDRLLHQLGFSLQSNRKSLEGVQHPDRDGQFRFINDRSTEFIASGDPVLSIDAKKKEVLANYKAAGQRWEPGGEPTRVDSHDFPFPPLGRALPTGSTTSATTTGSSPSASATTPPPSPRPVCGPGGTWKEGGDTAGAPGCC